MKSKEIIGKRFGKQVVIGLSDRKGYLVLKCDCGNIHEARREYVVRGKSKSCGCLRIEHAAKMGSSPKRYLSSKPHAKSSTGIRGVQKLDNGSYRAHICFNYQRIYLGCYPTLREAEDARKRAEETYYAPMVKSIMKGSEDL